MKECVLDINLMYCPAMKDSKCQDQVSCCRFNYWIVSACKIKSIILVKALVKFNIFKLIKFRVCRNFNIN